jgi:hypothetical protein
MQQKKFLNFIKRIFLYQHLIYFSLTKFDTNLHNSQKEFIHKSKILFLDLGFKNLYNISLPENDDILKKLLKPKSINNIFDLCINSFWELSKLLSNFVKEK